MDARFASPAARGWIPARPVCRRPHRGSSAWFSSRTITLGHFAFTLHHLGPRHEVSRVMLVSGDRESEVRYLADEVGISEVRAEQTPEQKVAIVEKETQQARTLFIGDGINDAPALIAATVGVAFGPNSDITSEAADAVILTASLGRVDELIHVSHRMRTIALQSAVGGMAASIIGMIAAAVGYLPPLEGAILQEIIDFIAVGNAVRVALPTKGLADF
jgi:cation transport ATPase